MGESPEESEKEKAERGSYQLIEISKGWASRGWGQALYNGTQ